MKYTPNSPFEKFCYYHGQCKAFLNTPKNVNGRTVYLTAQCAHLLDSYHSISLLLGNMDINNVFEQLCMVAAHEVSFRFEVPAGKAYQQITAQVLNK